ncbi:MULTISPECIES: heavy-metal-associated domain-containing protein [unclassified Flavobacterium]|jgi:Cu2+-exporting ATPase|uniref:heavy-metal-associated domain-containing protein n=1 Tax=unclassified Flavobacterium TaxID=196869 RepID=UPI0025BB0C9C|nr:MULTISPECIES: heavy metal-associated domain-containing protein [unclassified Flavobacterium]
MIHTYNITGMTCGGCRSNVENALNAINGIEATVTLQPPVATITMEKHVPITELQEVLKTVGDYTITVGNPNIKTSESPKSKSCCGGHKM